MATETRRGMIEFLKLYKEFTCLWDTSKKQYYNKDARNQAVQVLLDKLLMTETDATMDRVKRRLENMRAAYKREFKKVQQSIARGGDIYVPTLWYYEHLRFLDGGEMPDTSYKSTTEPVDSMDQDFNDETEVVETKVRVYELPPPSKLRSTNSIKSVETVTENEPNLVTTENTPSDIYGRSIGLQLGEMTKMQRWIAEKLISEVLFYGKLEKLTIQTSVSMPINYIIQAPSNNSQN